LKGIQNAVLHKGRIQMFLSTHRNKNMLLVPTKNKHKWRKLRCYGIIMVDVALANDSTFDWLNTYWKS